MTDVQSGQSVTYAIDMMNQSQNLAYFVIEEYSSAPESDVIFTDITLTYGAPDAADCKVAMRGRNDYISVPAPSATAAHARSRRSSFARRACSNRASP